MANFGVMAKLAIIGKRWIERFTDSLSWLTAGLCAIAALPVAMALFLVLHLVRLAIPSFPYIRRAASWFRRRSVRVFAIIEAHRRPWIWVALVFPVMAAIVALLLGPATNWLLGSSVSKIKVEDKRELVINGARQTLLAAAAGTAAATTLVFTSLAYSLSHKNHIIDRLEKARTNLTSAAAASDRDRLLSVYTLEGIMRTSPGERIAIMNILANFVRLRAGTPSPHTPRTSPAADVQAALAALGNWSNRSKSNLDLTNINLTHADFRAKNFKATDFSGSNLQDAKFDNAELREVVFSGGLSRASFRNSDLRDAKFEAVRVIDSPFRNAKLGRVTLRGDMSGANFSKAKMKSANLEGSMQGADFTGVDLRGSTLKGNVEDAKFQEADLRGTDLTGLYGLSRDQLQVANVNEKTALPRYLQS